MGKVPFDKRFVKIQYVGPKQTQNPRGKQSPGCSIYGETEIYQFKKKKLSIFTFV